MLPAHSTILADARIKCKHAEDALQEQTGRLRAMTAQLAEVSEAERQRLARRLHDQVGQNITALGINLNIIKSQLLPDSDPEIFSRLDDSMALVDRTTECIRDVMADLRPPMLDDYGLGAALHWYGEQFTQRTNIPVNVIDQDSIPRLPIRVENSLFRITQEALTNVAKHAQATQVTITLSEERGAVCLIVSDNGIGFEPAQLVKTDGSSGWGLLTIRERTESIGGHCCIESNPGQGTQVIVEVSSWASPCS